MINQNDSVQFYHPLRGVAHADATGPFACTDNRRSKQGQLNRRSLFVQASYTNYLTCRQGLHTYERPEVSSEVSHSLR